MTWPGEGHGQADVVCRDVGGGTVLARCHLLVWWWWHGAGQVSSAGMAIVVKCQPDVVYWYGGGGTVLARCHLHAQWRGHSTSKVSTAGMWWGHSAGQVSSAGMVVGAQCLPDVICWDSCGGTVPAMADVVCSDGVGGTVPARCHLLGWWWLFGTHKTADWKRVYAGHQLGGGCWVKAALAPIKIAVHDCSTPSGLE